MVNDKIKPLLFLSKKNIKQEVITVYYLINSVDMNISSTRIYIYILHLYCRDREVDMNVCA